MLDPGELHVGMGLSRGLECPGREDPRVGNRRPSVGAGKKSGPGE